VSESMLDPKIVFELQELESAAQLVYRVMPPTPLYAWPKLKRRAGCSVYVKHENHTPTGAFKVRGGIVYLDRLCRSLPNVAGVITATRGNHGQSIAFAAARAGIPATIYVPAGNSPDQNSAIAGFGAKLVEFGRDFDEAKHEAFRVSGVEDLHFVPSFHRDLVAGVASYALELFRGGGELDAVYVGVGMGSGICGLITVRDLLGLKTDIIGVGPIKAPATALSFAAGQPVMFPSANTLSWRGALGASERGRDRGGDADLFR
jgi:threonine dehydratase